MFSVKFIDWQGFLVRLIYIQLTAIIFCELFYLFIVYIIRERVHRLFRIIIFLFEITIII